MLEHESATTVQEARDLTVKDACVRQQQAGRSVIEDTDFPGFYKVYDGNGVYCGYIHKAPSGEVHISISP